jgi:hypothetical protein
VSQIADYGHDIEFGYFLVPDAEDPEGVAAARGQVTSGATLRQR